MVETLKAFRRIFSQHIPVCALIAVRTQNVLTPVKFNTENQFPSKNWDGLVLLFG